MWTPPHLIDRMTMREAVIAEAINKAILEERERCARLVEALDWRDMGAPLVNDQVQFDPGYEEGLIDAWKKAAEAIRSQP